MIDFIVFDTETEMENAMKICWVETVKNIVSEGYVAIDTQDNVYSNIDSLTDNQIDALKLCSKNKNGCNIENCYYTIAYQTYLKAYQQEKFFAPKPESALLNLLSNYQILTAEEVFNDGYYPPEV